MMFCKEVRDEMVQPLDHVREITSCQSWIKKIDLGDHDAVGAAVSPSGGLAGRAAGVLTAELVPAARTSALHHDVVFLVWGEVLIFVIPILFSIQRQII